MVTSQAINAVEISDLWKLDLIGIKDEETVKTRAELMEAAKEHFSKTVSTNNEGRYVVHLPWIEGHSKLPTNYDMAVKRLHCVTNRLKAEGQLYQYGAIFQAWLKEEIIEHVMSTEYEGHYLPHRPVIKQNSETTKIRPVFDASARTRTTASLNDCLEKGPNLVELIPSVLLDFRTKRIGVTADIKKAFLQINVKKEDCNYLKFLWWEEAYQKLIVYRHLRVVFGVTSSPFLLCAVISHHLDQAPMPLQAVAQQLKKSFYVDNCVTSVSTVEELKSFINQSRQIMSTGSFDLRGWEYSGQADDHRVISILGLLWNKEQDTLRCNMEHLQVLEFPKITKRIVLSVVQKIFDPIGFTSPITLLPKLLLQETWIEKISWDEELKPEMRKRFQKWVSELEYLHQIKIPRWLRTEEKSKLPVHTFCDASNCSYAAVVFLREETVDKVNIRLIMAKSRVAPVKIMTIPRLELLAALVGARLTHFVRQNLRCVSEVKGTLWSDSTTVLAWLSKTEIWGTFVNNRVNEIRDLTNNNQWRHVPGHMKPADLPSRGCSIKQLVENRWWEGPVWLRFPEVDWPNSKVTYDDSQVNEEKRKSIVSLVNVTATSESYWKFFSTYTRIVRVVGWQMRFIYNCKTSQANRVKGRLSVVEIQDAGKKLLKLVQREAFSLKNEKALKNVCAYKDPEDDLLRIKTRITGRTDTKNFRFPIVLPAKHPLVELLIREKHGYLLHAGLQITLNTLREDYWILGAKKERFAPS